MSEGRSTRQQVPLNCVTEEELALDKLVNVIRLRYPDTTWERLTCDGRPFVHVGDGEDYLTLERLPDLGWVTKGTYPVEAHGVTIHETATRAARRMADDYMAMAVAALAIMGG